MKCKTLDEYLNSDIEFYEYSNENFIDFLNAANFTFDIPYIHVTGTSGKTILSTLLKNIYAANNYKVGLIVSTEMNTFDKQSDKYAGFAELFQKYWKLINQFELTKYEVLFFLYLNYLKEKNVDLAIIETFMGGYFDPSNIEESSILSIVNNVGLEHCEDLGKSVSEITYSKCGIIKDDSLVLLNTFDEDIDFVVNEVCKKNKAKLVKVAEFYDYDLVDNSYLQVQYFPFPKFRVNTTALYNRENVACALEVVNLLNSKFPCTNENIQKGLLEPLGFGYINIKNINGKRVIFDKANNAFSIQKLCKSLEFSFEDDIEQSTILFAVDYDKNIEKMLSILSRITHDIVLTTIDFSNMRDEDGFYLFLEDYSYNPDFKDALDKMLATDDVKNIIVTGDLNLINVVNDYLGK